MRFANKSEAIEAVSALPNAAEIIDAIKWLDGDPPIFVRVDPFTVFNANVFEGNDDAHA